MQGSLKAIKPKHRKNDMTKSVKLTPMLRQYLEIKEQYPDTILFYRMGDFYEMFFDDAVTAAKILNITLTSRSAKDEENRVPMCGIPYHAISNYLNKLVKAGFKVAICEQVEDPKTARGIVKREVLRVETPGVTTDEQILEEKDNTFVAAVSILNKRAKKQKAGMAFIDVSTGDFFVAEVVISKDNFSELLDNLALIKPAELILNRDDEPYLKPVIPRIEQVVDNLCLTWRDGYDFTVENSEESLCNHFKTANMAGFGCKELKGAISAAGALLSYIYDNRKSDLTNIRTIRIINKDNCLQVDESSRRNLELTETIVGGHRAGSLLDILDATCTSMGARYLKQQLLFPLSEQKEIQNRLHSVDTLVNEPSVRNDIRTILADIYDLERLASRLVQGQGNGRDLLSLGLSLSKLPDLKKILLALPVDLLHKIGAELDPMSQLHDLISSSIREDAPIAVKEGKIIKDGFNPELDELIILLRDGKQLIAQLESKERERTGNPKLKVGYNRVFGYYFEISKAQAASIPEDFIRKQTLANAERFISPELKELENKISTAQEKRLDLEYQIFLSIRENAIRQSEKLLHTASLIAQVDFIASLAEIAVKNHYVKPSINNNKKIIIKEGRHPVIEKSLPMGKFVPNDINLDQEKQQVQIITGPNMAGKSTVLRQAALIVLMTHVGSFVPADMADICMTDRIFTRVGAMDNLRKGQSTFMVEMNETANILNNATSNSLVILDEIGRGTSTYDGLSIAWAVAEDLANKDGIGVKTMFATHYHELTALAATHPRIKNFSIAVKEWQGSIVFLHKLVAGATNRSYGIQVAELAGVPPRVISRAKEILKNIEQEQKISPTEIAPQAKERQPYQISIFGDEGSGKVNKMLSDTNPDELSPKEALELLYKLKDAADN